MPTNKHKSNFAPPWMRRIFSLGVSDQFPSWENNLTRLLNQLLLLASGGVIALGIYHSILGNYLAVAITLFCFAVNIGTLFLQWKKRLFTARLVACLFYPLLILGIITLGGDSVRGEYIFFTISFICAVLFQNRWIQVAMAAYVIALYALSQWVVQNNLAPLSHLSHPFDRYIFFAVSLLGLFFLANSFFNQIVRYRKDREKLVEQLIASNTKLKQMNYVVSHDLRSPMRRIASFTDLARLAHRRGEEELVEEYLATVKDSARKLHDFIADMLTFAQLDDQSLKFAPVQLDTLIAETENQFSTENVLIEMTNNVEETAILGNKTLLGVVFQNLVENAIKYNISDLPQINISIQSDEKGLALRFSDNGIGIPAEKQEEIFKIFTRLHDSSQYEGTGIGLATVKGIVELHHGTIEVEPQANGTCFLIHLPVVANIQKASMTRAEMAQMQPKSKVRRLLSKRRASIF